VEDGGFSGREEGARLKENLKKFCRDWRRHLYRSGGERKRPTFMVGQFCL